MVSASAFASQGREVDPERQRNDKELAGKSGFEMPATLSSVLKVGF